MFNLTKSLKRNLSIGKPRMGRMNINMTNKQFKKADFDGDGVPNWKDCRPLDPTRDMVHYGYYEAELEDGKKMPIYSGSKKGAKKVADDMGLKSVSIVELTYPQAKEKYGEEGLMSSRSKVKNTYKWTGDKIIDV